MSPDEYTEAFDLVEQITHAALDLRNVHEDVLVTRIAELALVLSDLENAGRGNP